jgi:ComF family protein
MPPAATPYMIVVRNLCAFRRTAVHTCQARGQTIAVVLRQLSSVMAPPRCAICARPCDPERVLCAGCERKVARLKPVRSTLTSGLDVISAAPYEGIAQELVRRLKFSSRLALAEVAAERMVRAWGATRAGWLVPVPPSPARQRVRGFDDAAILARLVARECPGAHVLPCLSRDDGPRQVHRSRRERTADPPRVTPLSESFVPPASNTWLVDDVATTGATLSACARALRVHGAQDVRALTFARAD